MNVVRFLPNFVAIIEWNTNHSMWTFNEVFRINIFSFNFLELAINFDWMMIKIEASVDFIIFWF